jgi:hypothetical protein
VQRADLLDVIAEVAVVHLRFYVTTAVLLSLILKCAFRVTLIRSKSGTACNTV